MDVQCPERARKGPPTSDDFSLKTTQKVLSKVLAALSIELSTYDHLCVNCNYLTCNVEADNDIQELDLQCMYRIPNLRKDASCILQNGTYNYTEH